MKTNVSYYQNKKEFRLFVTQSYSQLIQLKKEGDQASFNALVLKIMPQIRQYINTQLNVAIRKGHFSKNKFKADDIIDQLFIEIYDHIEDVKQENDFYVWLLKKTNDLLEDITVEEEFDEFFFKNIDDYTRPEWDEMQEKYSTDGGGDLLLIEELDDMSYNHNDYTLNHVFIKNDEKALVKKIDKDLNDEDVKHHIEMVLHNLPVNMRTVFELATTQHLELEEIAQIRHNTLEEVKQLLSDAKKALQISLFNRYSVN
ncbi:RNA polymerase sigma factor [Winogradskyella eximia]|uniref:RNA polymerase sigma factor n=1 Tax=Winogradskyella eximia TaxID=262006 RepID=UPI00248FA1F9|nr:sigma-70 family RNA polymerase sigma factor [Winogradskyella eximia]